jgi:hypothetical protein
LLCLCTLLEFVALSKAAHTLIPLCFFCMHTPQLACHIILLLLHAHFVCRRAVLLASCSSQQAAAWVLATPVVLQQLQQQTFQIGGAAEAHGALWELVITKSSSTGASSTAAKSGQLLELLALDSSNVSNLQRQVALLQLLADVQQAAGSRQQVWGAEVVAALKHVAAKIKSLQASTAAATADGAAGAERSHQGTSFSRDGVAADIVSAANEVQSAGPGGGSSSSDGGSDDDDAEGKGAKALRRLQQQQQQLSSDAGGDDVDALGQRQRQQLQPTALKLIKQLLTSGGKTD